jgi:hypothetical protein
MFCPKCGTQNLETGKFCRSCGTDLSPVSDALAGTSTDFQMPLMSPKQMRNQNAQIYGKDKKPINYEQAITKIFTGLAFLIVAAVLGITKVAGGQFWWFWMLIPAFGSLGSGIAQYMHLRKSEKNDLLISAQETNQIPAHAPNAALPSTQNVDYVKPQNSIYDTGELVAPPSIVEGTTRHLEINREGETMTLPKK